MTIDELLRRQVEDANAEIAALRQQLSEARARADGLRDVAHHATQTVADLDAELQAERQKRCGTCHWWLNDRCHCGVTCPVHLRWVPSDFGCPHWRGKEAK